MIHQEYLQTIRNLIAKDQLDKALADLKGLLSNTPALDEILQQSGRFEHIRKQIRLGTVSHAEATLTTNQIRAGLLELVSEIERQGLRPEIRAEIERARTIIIENSKNVVAGSTISAGGNVHIGDTIINTHNGKRELSHLLTQPPFLPEIFIGRENDLQKIHNLLFAPEGHLLLLVNGEGGVGKTSIASQYYHRYKEEYQHVAWVLSERSIAEALLSLAIPLNLKFEDAMNTARRLERLLLEMANLAKPCLLVVDNANELNDLNTYYPQLQRCTNFHVLFTTRISEYKTARFYKINPLPQDQALEAFRTHYKAFDRGEEPIFFELYDAVGGNTLVLELFAKHLNHFNTRLKKRYSLAQMKSDVEMGLLRLNFSEAVEVRYHAKQGIRKATPEAIIAAMYDLDDLTHSERVLLSVFAVLPAERIPFAHIEALVKISDLDQHLLLTAQKGWLEYNESEASFKCSPVIQEVVFHKTENILEWVQITINRLNDKLLPEWGSGILINASFEEGFIYVRYAESVIDSFPKHDRSLAILCERSAYFYQTTGNLPKALLLFEANLEAWQAMANLMPDDPDTKHRQSVALERLGEIQSALGNLSQALIFFENGTKLFEELNKDYPQNATFINGLAISIQYLGMINDKMRNLPQALTFYKKYHELEKKLHEAEPENKTFKNGLAISYQLLASIHRKMGNLTQALTYVKLFNRLSEDLSKAEPQNDYFKYGLAISYHQLGNSQNAIGEMSKALPFHEKFVELMEELHHAYPQNVEFKNGLAISYEKLGSTYSMLGNLTQVLTFYERYYELKKDLHQAYPLNVEYKNGLAISYEKLGSTHSAQGNLPLALTFYEKYNELEKELHEAYPQHVDFKNGLAISYSKLGSTHTALGNLPKALTFYEEYNRLEKELHEAYPQNVGYKNNLAISYQYLGITHTALGNLPKALTFYEKDLELSKELHEAYPQHVDFKNGLAISYSKLGVFHRDSMKDPEKGRAYLQQCHAIYKELVERYPEYQEFRNNYDWVKAQLGK